MLILLLNFYVSEIRTRIGKETSSTISKMVQVSAIRGDQFEMKSSMKSLLFLLQYFLFKKYHV